VRAKDINGTFLGGRRTLQTFAKGTAEAGAPVSVWKNDPKKMTLSQENIDTCEYPSAASRRYNGTGIRMEG